MAVYTHLTVDEMDRLLSRYDEGGVRRFTPIAEGVENSNYLVETGRGKRILTLFEQRVKLENLPFYMGLMRHLAGKGIACPVPVAAKDGTVIQRLDEKQKSAAIVTFLYGRGLQGDCTADEVRQVGALTAQLHLAGKDYSDKRANDLSLAGWRRLFERTAERAGECAPGLAQIIEDELHFLMHAWPVAQLPSGVVHADLFPDNIFFENGKLSGVIDFYFACNDAWAYDLAITFNAWCFGSGHGVDLAKAKAFIEGYQSVRLLTETEKRHFPTLARGAALRFMLTRLYDWLNRVDEAVVTVKDPMEYLAKLRFHQGQDVLKAVMA